MQANTSGKHGFGVPKTFRFTSIDPASLGSYTLHYRDTEVGGKLHSSQKRNFELVMAAIAQFCLSAVALSAEVVDELNLECVSFDGEVTNRYGRVVSQSSFLPRRRPHLSDLQS